MKIMIFLISSFMVIYLSACSGCANTDRTARNKQSANQIETPEVIEKQPEVQPSKKWEGTTEINMIRENGIYKVPIEINGSKMDFIFDTGASSICISETEAKFLVKQGTLNQDDVIGEESFSDANGDISSGMVVKLKSVKIGDRVLNNVQALIVPNDKAPLLLGQTALAQFGKISIDYQKGTISFE
jgi:aspartyl protease family protein